MATPNNSFDCSGIQVKDKQTELKKVKEYLFKNTATMKAVTVNTGIIRENICRRIADLRKAGQICKVKIGKCPITGHRNVGFYTTNPTLFITKPQLNLFGKENVNG